MTDVKITKTGLYGVNLAKKAKPADPKPRDANIRPPPQQNADRSAGTTDDILSIFSFINNPFFPYLFWSL